MPIAPEVWQTPGIIYQFARGGLLGDLVQAALLGRSVVRNWAKDGRQLAQVFPAEIRGVEHIPEEGGCLLLANHPRIDVALVAFYQFGARLAEKKNRDLVLLMAGELALWGDFSFPWIQTLLSRFQALYPETLIPVPIIKSRPGYRSGRLQATERARRALQRGKAVILTPEARTEKGNVILPTDVYRYGAGGLVKEASESGIALIPLAVWTGPGRGTVIRVGEPFTVDLTLTDQRVAIEVMGKVAALMPNELRGPFADPA
jgi:hypothetical protein